MNNENVVLMSQPICEDEKMFLRGQEFMNLSPDAIRDLMAQCPESYDDMSDEELGDEGDGQPREYTCQIDECMKVFTDILTYRKHLVTHGERLYRCTQEGCGKKFLDNSKLKRH